MSLTIKQAFEALSDACAKGMKNPFFVMRSLKDSFADVADKVVADGSVVDVVPAQDSGFLVGNVKVDGTDHYLYAPAQPPTPHIYSDTERLVGVWFHDGISEDVYERTVDISNVSKDDTNPTVIMPATNKIVSAEYSGLYTVDGIQYLIDCAYVIVAYGQNFLKNFNLYTVKETSNYTAYWTGSGTLNSLIATYRYTKASN